MQDHVTPTSVANDNEPLFVVGMWRSGTSLLYALLNQHSHLALMYEGDLPLLRPLFRNGKAKSDWLERWEFWNGALSRHEVNLPSAPDAAHSLPEAMRLVYRRFSGLARWGCKSPNYFDRMVQLAQDFPNASFIVIYRDPFEICRSVVRAARKSYWFAKLGMPLRALLGYREMKRQAERLTNLGVRVHQLQYEDLVRNPNRVLGEVCTFLQIPFDPRMAGLEGADRSAIYDAEHHAGVKGKKIFAAGEREEVLSPAFQRKVRRYVNFWHREHGGTWPVHPHPDSSQARPAGSLERALDALCYRALRTLDETVIWIYCYAPMRLLRAYRSLKPSKQELSRVRKANDKLESAAVVER
jgi:hypothetical protein